MSFGAKLSRPQSEKGIGTCKPNWKHEPILLMDGASSKHRKNPSYPQEKIELRRKPTRPLPVKRWSGDPIEDSNGDDVPEETNAQAEESRVAIKTFERYKAYVRDTPLWWKDCRERKQYKQSKSYSWVSTAEMKVIRERIKRELESGGREFLIYEMGEVGIAVALIPERTPLNNRSLNQRANQQIFTLWRKAAGLHTLMSHHSITCTLRAQREIVNPCGCMQKEELLAINQPQPWRVGPYTESPQGSSWSYAIDPSARQNERLDPELGCRTYACFTLKLEVDRKEDDFEDQTGKSVDGRENIGEDLAKIELEDAVEKEEGEQEETELPPREANREAQLRRLGRGRYREDIYRCGGMLYLRQDAADHVRRKKGSPTFKSSQEIPKWDTILGRDGIYDPKEEYPLISREEIIEVMRWLENAPEDQKHGKHYLLHKADDGSIVVSLILDEKAKLPGPTVERQVLKLQRQTRMLLIEESTREVLNAERPRHTVPGATDRAYQGPRHVRARPDGSEWVNRNPANIQQNGEEPLTVTALDQYPVGSKPEEAGAACVCMAVRLEKEEGPDGKLANEGEPKAKGEESTEYDAKGLGGDEEEPEVPDLWEIALEDPELADEIAQKFPIHIPSRNLPVYGGPSNGMLAAMEVIPIAQYGDREDFEFYARGVTLALDDEEGDTTYYRGNALIRIAGNDRRPKLKTPTRSRVNQMRERLFRMGQYSREGQETLKDELTSRNILAPVEEDRHTTQRLGVDHGPLVGSPPGGNLTANELKTVIDDLVANPIEDPGKKRVYEIKKLASERIAATRIPLNMNEWRGVDRSAGKRADEKYITAEDLTRIGVEALTRLGRDPPVSDQRPAKIHQVHEMQSEEWGEISGQAMRDRGPQPRWELSREVKCEGIESLATEESIKRTRVAHQEESISDENQPEKSPLPVHNQPTPTPDCFVSMSQNHDSLGPTQTPLKSLATTYSFEPVARQTCPPLVHSELDDNDELVLPLVPNLPRPGLVAATHLALLPAPESTPQEPSFFGFGATVVYADEQGLIHSYKGHALVHMYALNSARTFHFPPSPPRARSEAARAYLFPPGLTCDSALGDDRGTRPARIGELLPPISTFRFNPSSTNSAPTPQVEEAPPNSPVQVVSEHVGGGRDLVAAKTLASMKNPFQRNTIPTSNALSVTTKTAIDLSPGETRRESENLSAGTDRSSDDPPKFKKIEFVTGGIMPGNVDTGDPGKVDRPNTSKTFCQPTPDPRKGRQPQLREQKSIAHLEVDELDDVDMEFVEVEGGLNDDAPLPDLSYPPSDEQSTDNEEGQTLTSILIAPRQPVEATAVEVVVSNLPGLEPIGDDKKNTIEGAGGERGLPELSKQFLMWKKSIVDLKARLNHGPKWTDAEAQKIFGDLGLLQWWYDIRQEEEAGHEPDWQMWRGKIVAEWRRRYPDVPAEEFDSVEDTLNEDERPQTARSLFLQVNTAEKEDVEMDENDSLSKNPLPFLDNLNAFHTPTPLPKDGVFRYPRMPETDEIGELKSRVAELEDHFAEMGDDMREDLKSLREQVFQDGVTLTDLKWRLDGPRAGKGKEGGKRGYRKAKAKGPTHRYPTRYWADQAQEVVELSSKAYEDLANRVRRVEERQEGAHREVKRLEAELTHVEELSPKIDALADSLDDFKCAQLKVNVGILKELVKLRTHNADTVDPKLTAHTSELSLLTARYNILQSIASSLISRANPPATNYATPEYKVYPPHFPHVYPRLPPYQLDNQAKSISVV